MKEKKNKHVFDKNYLFPTHLIRFSPYFIE